MISVILSTYNEPINFIQKSISSILEQTYNDLELIVINDNPKRKELDEILVKYQRWDSRIKYLKNEENLGLVKSLNKGIRLACGEYIARMDADDIAINKRLEWQIKYLVDKSLDIVGGNVDKIDENDNLISSLYVPIEQKKIIKYQKYGSCILHPTWLVRRSVYIALGGYREIQTCEDYDFLLRAINQGYKLGNVPEVVLKYRIRTSGISISSNAQQKLTTYYLATNMRNIQDVSVDMVNEYINSEKYRKDLKMIQTYHTDKMTVISKSEKLNRKLFAVGKVVFNKFFYVDVRSYLMRKKRESIFS